MLAGRQCLEEEARRVGAEPATQELIGLDYDRQRDHELTAEPSDKLRGDAVGPVAPVGRR